MSRVRPIAAGPAGAIPIDPWVGLWPIMFYLLIEYARPMTWIPPLKVIRPGMIAVLWSLAALFWFSRRPLPTPTKWILAFVVLMVFQVPLADNHGAALSKLRLEFAPLLVGLLLPLSVLPNSLSAMRNVMTVFFIVHVPTAVWGLQHNGYGPGGWMGDQNDLAFALNSAIGIGCFLLIEARSVKRKLWILGALAVLVSAVIASFSRGGLLGLVAVSGYVFLTAKRARGTMLAVLLVGVLAVLMFAPAEWKAEMETIDEAGGAQDTGGKRLYYWGIGWKMFRDHPIAGVGTENFGHRAPEYRDLSRYRESMWHRSSHSLYFTLLPEHGLVGVFIYGGMLLATLKGHRRLQRRYREQPDDETRRSAAILSGGLFAGIAASMITGVFVSVLYYPSVWVLVCMVGSTVATADAADAAREGAAR